MPRWSYQSERSRFESHVDMTGDCWLWSGARNEHGYGKFAIDGSWMLAHRYAWEYVNGKVPSGFEVCHRCDNPACVREAHLFLGTHAENMADSKEKGRAKTIPGELRAKAKLTPEQVQDIRSSTEPLKVLSDRHGVSKSMVSQVRRRRAWRHIP